MPIYAYRCAACGHAQDVLQKMSDALLTVCPACGASSFQKQLTAAGFQLKGSGWYVTDFRGGNTGAKADKDERDDKAAADALPAAEKSADKPADNSGEKGSDSSADKPAKVDPAAGKTTADKSPGAKPTPAPAATPAAGAAKPSPPAGSGGG